MRLSEAKKRGSNSQKGKAEQNREFCLSHTFHLTLELADLFFPSKVEESHPNTFGSRDKTKQLSEATQVSLTKFELLRGADFTAPAGDEQASAQRSLTAPTTAQKFQLPKSHSETQPLLKAWGEDT